MVPIVPCEGEPVVVIVSIRPPVVAGVAATTILLLIIERAVELVELLRIFILPEEVMDNRSVSIEDIDDLIRKFPS